MKADRTPEISGPPQKQAQQESKQHHRCGALYILVRIEEVAQAEQAGHQECRGPEADSGRECVLDVSAKQEFFNQSDQQKRNGPPEKRIQNCHPVKRQPGYAETVQQKHAQQRPADRQKADQRANPEALRQGQSQRQTIFTEFAMFNFPHRQRSDAENQQSEGFRPAHQKRRDRDLSLISVSLAEGCGLACSDQNETSQQDGNQSEEHENSPARPQTVGSDKNLLQFERGMGTWLERFRGYYGQVCSSFHRICERHFSLLDQNWTGHLRDRRLPT